MGGGTLYRRCSELFVKVDEANSTKDYSKILERTVIESLTAYAQTLVTIWLENENCSSYLEKTEALIEEEQRRVEDCLQNQSTEIFANALREEIIGRHRFEILQKPTGLKYMIQVLS